MDTTASPLVIVDGLALDDVLELTARLLERLDPNDALTKALSGARAQVLASSLPEPH